MARARDLDYSSDSRSIQRALRRRARYIDRDDYYGPRSSYRGPPRRGRPAYRRPMAGGRGRTYRRGARVRQEGPSLGLILGLLTNVVLISALGIIYLFFPATWQRLIHLRDAGPAPLSAGADLIVLAHSVPWGVLSLDDKSPTAPTPSATAQGTVTPSPTRTPPPATTPQVTATATPSNALSPAGSVDGYPYFKLPRGKHTLFYAAAPFTPLRCQFSVPAASDDTCPIAQAAPLDDVHALGGAARVVDAQATADTLSPDLQKALFDAVGAALTPQPTTMQLYEHYLNTSGKVIQTYVTLQATLLYAVNTDPTLAIKVPAPGAKPVPPSTPTPVPAGKAPVPTPTGVPVATPTIPMVACISLCDPPITPAITASATPTVSATPSGTATPTSATTPTDTWNQLANAVPSWRYQPTRGQPIAGAVGAQAGATTSAVVNIRWNGQWQVSAKDTDKAALLSSLVLAAAGTLRLPSGWSLKAYPAANPADGYLVVAGPATGGSPAQLLYRFGVLLAVNSAAYTTFPTLLHGSFAERTLAAGIKTG